MKEITKDTNRWRNMPYSWIRRINIMKYEYENEYTIQSNLQIQYNPYQATNGILYRTRTNFTIYMEIQKNLE